MRPGNYTAYPAAMAYYFTIANNGANETHPESRGGNNRHMCRRAPLLENRSRLYVDVLLCRNPHVINPQTEKAMYIYKENTRDNGAILRCHASDNAAEYQLTSAYAHDLHSDYLERYSRQPSARWYNRHFNFIRIK